MIIKILIGVFIDFPKNSNHFSVMQMKCIGENDICTLKKIKQ